MRKSRRLMTLLLLYDYALFEKVTESATDITYIEEECLNCEAIKNA
jgi:hypothetical protein